MAKLTNFSGQPFSGLVPHAVIGVVTDNVDEDELGRIKVKFPTLPDEPESYWLRQISPMAGAERGLYALPEIDDEVLVLFMQGSQDVGVIIGHFWNGVDVPPTEAKDGLPGSSETDTGGSWSTDTFSDGSTSLDDNDRRFWKSRSGHLLVFDDTDGSESVQVWDKNHELALVLDSANSAVYLTNNSGDLHIRTKGDLYLESGGDTKIYSGANIEVESSQSSSWTTGTGYEVESGTSTDITAGTAMTLEASTGFEAKGLTAKVEGSTTAEFKGGAKATLKGSGMAEVSGGIVKIN